MPSRKDPAGGRQTADVVVIGDGIIGLSTALELSARGARSIVFGADRSGIASFAAAGLLAPSIGQLPAAARSFCEASLELYPAMLGALAEFDDGLSLLSGLLVIGEPHGGQDAAARGRRLTEDEARRFEPAAHAPHGALLYPNDGAIDNVRLMRALRAAAEHDPMIELVANGPVTSVELGSEQVTVRTDVGQQATATRVVLAAGAWSPQVRGLPRPVPVVPLKGQMLAFDVCPMRQPVVGNGAYLVPRGTETIVGSTSEQTGFDISTTKEGIDGLRAAAAASCPALAGRTPARVWAGLRPATPDMLPILGRDPDCSALVYATGHSRNGILLAPASARAVADLVIGTQPSFDLSGFGIARFRGTADVIT